MKEELHSFSLSCLLASKDPISSEAIAHLGRKKSRSQVCLAAAEKVQDDPSIKTFFACAAALPNRYLVAAAAAKPKTQVCTAREKSCKKMHLSPFFHANRWH